MNFIRFQQFHIPGLLTKFILFFLCLIPCATLVHDAVMANLGANPVEEITARTGEWALRFLLITLAVSPLRRCYGLKWVGRMRRMLGLYAFFYAVLHMLTYVVLEQFFDWSMIASELFTRPYLTVGMLGFLMMIPLAMTSFNLAMKWMGKVRWRLLHRLVYLSATACVLHYLWLVKADYREPVLYAIVLIVLLASRVVNERKKAAHAQPRNVDQDVARPVSGPR